MEEEDLEIGCTVLDREEQLEDYGEDEEECHERLDVGSESDASLVDFSCYETPARDGVMEHPDDSDDDEDEASVENIKESSHPVTPRPGLQRMKRFKMRSSIVRRKSSVDIETGNAQEHVIQCQTVVDELYFQPMNPSKRWWKLFLRRHEEGMAQRRRSLQERSCQYRLTSNKAARGFWNHLKLATSEDFHVHRGLNGLIAKVLVWTFQTNIIIVFLASSSLFICFTLIFGIAIYIAGRSQPGCIDVGIYDFNSSGHYFIDAFSLSWQTMTTAGYGIIYPSVYAQNNQYCVGLNILTALESFWGVVFAGCITAIIFSKVVRVQAVAAVEFCDPVVVRYGTGVMPNDDDDVSSQASSSDVEMRSRAAASRAPRKKNNSDMENMISSRSLIRDKQIPCPILEFRLMNRLHDHVGGEICNANVNVVAVTAASRASPSIRAAVERRRWSLRGQSQSEFRQRKHAQSIQKKLQKGGAKLRSSAYKAGAVTGAVLQKSGDALLRKSGAATVIHKSATVLQKLNQTLTSVPETQSMKESLKRPSRKDSEGERSTYDVQLPLSVIEATRQHLAVDEEPSSSLVPRRIFSKLDIETDRHPFFKRVWHIRHVLNQNSPLLSHHAKGLVEENQGYWPEELNTYEQVRKHVHFYEIIVNFSGTSNVSGATVYGQKVYEFADLNVGYRFAPLLFKSDTGKLVVDSSLLNDVLEQLGGGAEPLTIASDADFAHKGETALNVAKTAARVTAEAALSSADAAAHATVRVAQSTAAAVNSVARATTGVTRTATYHADANASGFLGHY